jgi:hypothetical protein
MFWPCSKRFMMTYCLPDFGMLTVPVKVLPANSYE